VDLDPDLDVDLDEMANEPVDCLVIGAGLAGTVAALRVHGAGRSVAVLADGAGATGLSSGALLPDPRLGAEDLAWLTAAVPGAFFVRADGRPQRVPTAAGRIIEVLASPPETFDLPASAARRVAVVGADLSGAPDLRGLTALLAAADGRSREFLAVHVPSVVHDDFALLGPSAVAGRLVDDAMVRELAAKAAQAAAGAGADAILLPSYVPAAAVGKVREAAGGRLVGRLLGTYALAAGGGALAAALHAALRAAGIDLRTERVHAVRREGGLWTADGAGARLAAARTLIVATGDASGGGVGKRGRIFAEPDPSGGLSCGGEPLRQEGAALGPAADAYLPRRLLDGAGARTVGVATDERMRPAGAAPGMFLAGALAACPGGSSDGLAWALVSSLRAAREALAAPAGA
jgi:hypothetical protein